MGVFLAEYARDTWMASAVRFAINTSFGVPSIIIGMFVYILLVKPFETFSGYSGGVALAIIMVPIVAGTTADLLRMVPDSLREATMALGAPRWRSILMVFRAARNGILTGVLLAVARVSGETAPLLFTALDNPYFVRFDSPRNFHRSLSEPTANLPITIFNRAMSPYDDWQQAAWAGALLITLGILFITILSRLFLRRKIHV
jgi:phosphate transport system permease protein